MTGSDGKVTYTYTLRDDLKWSDGSALTASDFVYAWNRAVDPATAADYANMFSVIDKSYTENTEGTGLYDLVDGKYVVNADGTGKYDAGKLNVTAKDDKTIEVVLATPCAYWEQLLAFPTYMPVKQSAIEASPDAWATDPSTYVSNGPYILKSWDHNSKMVYVKNPNYFNADKITMGEIDFYLSDDASNMLANFENGAWQFIDDVPTDEIQNLKSKYPDEFKEESQIGTYYVCFNVNKSLLPSDSTLTGADAEKANQEIRNALSLLFDRNYIVTDIGQADQVPASSFVSKGLTDANGSDFYTNAGNQSANGYYGYYNVSADALDSNIQTALTTLKKYWKYDETSKQFTNAPTIEYLYNTSEGHKKIAEYLQKALSNYGISMTLTNQEWATFLQTRKKGDFNVARDGWLADYNDPSTMLTLFTSGSGNNDCQLGKGDNASLKAYSIKLDKATYGVDKVVTDGTWADTYDYLMDLAEKTTDKTQRSNIMHAAEDLLMSTGAVCPLYYYTDLYMISSKVTGEFNSPLGYKYFMYTNIAD